jgi:UDP-N-acetylglucosamine--dolichyl-phosphate N-acetylglucosaminephosphotransferase
MSRTVQLSVLLVLGLVFPVVAFCKINDPRIKSNIAASFLVSTAGFFATTWLIPIVAAKTLKRGIAGKDLNKKGTEAGDRPIPEAAGLAPGCIFLLCIICFQLLHYYDIHNIFEYIKSGFQGTLIREPIADGWLVDYNAALATIGFMLFLGFADDVLDVPWRVKLVLPLFAAMPLLVAYSGGTGIAVPKPLQATFGLPTYLELGILYKLYMVSLTIFCANSINILAGVNGLEAGQTFIIACAVLCHNLWMLAGQAGTVPAVRDGHLFSAYLMLPLAATCFGLLVHNWYPSTVFVGDTFTYFAGMAIAVAGILGHFSETLLLFLVPQIFNFLYSCPQIFKIIPCPRHRLPVFDPKTGLLRPKDTPDWNVVQLMLQLTGNTTENQLCIRILVFQALCCAGGFGIRWFLTGVYK